MSDIVLVIELVDLLGVGDSVYLTSGPVAAGISANYYPYLQRSTVSRSEQRFNHKTCSTSFPELSFSVVDQGLEITKLLADNAAAVPSCEVLLWQGDTLGTFPADYDRKYIGGMETPTRSGGMLNFTLGPALRKTEYPVDIITGSAEIDADVTDPTVLTIKLRNVVNLNTNMPNLAVNPGFETALGAEWIDGGSGNMVRTTAGKLKGSYSLENTAGLGDSTDRSRTQQINVSIYQVYQFSAYVVSDGETPVGTYEIGLDEYDADDNFIKTVTTGALVRPPDHSRYFPVLDDDVFLPIWQRDGVIYIPSAVTAGDSADAAYVIVRVLCNHEGGSTRTCKFDEVSFSAVMLARCNNEVMACVSVQDSGTDAGTATLAPRGLFGSMPKRHKEGDLVLFFNYFRGHPLDLVRRFLTSTAAGTNGALDDGAGQGMGNYFKAAWLGDSWNTEKVRSGGTTPLDEYDHANYRMDFTLDSRIENGKEFIEKEFLLPLCAMWYIDDSGLLQVRLLDSVDAGDATTLLPADIMNGGSLLDDSSERDDVINEVTYRMDHDPVGADDKQGDLSGGSSRFMREEKFNEASFGDDNQLSLARYGVCPLEVIDARGMRGYGSVLTGLSDNLNGDRMAFERARVWLTRWRFERQRYSVPVAFRKAGMLLGATPAVTSNAMVDAAIGVMGRSTAVMFVTSQEGPNYDDAQGTIELFASGDQPAIPNTSAAAAMPTPDVDDWTLVIRPLAGGSATFASVGARYRRMTIFPRGYANIGWITLFYGGVGSPLAPQLADYLLTRVYVYRVIELKSTYPAGTSHGAIWKTAKAYVINNIVQAADGLLYIAIANNTSFNPTGGGNSSKWSVHPVGTFAVGNEFRGIEDEGIVLFSSATAPTNYTQSLYAQICYVNKDLVEGTKSDFKTVTKVTAVDHEDRHPQRKIMQTSADGRRDGTGGPHTSWSWG